MTEKLIFGRVANNELIEANAKLSPYIGTVPLSKAAFYASDGKFGAVWDEERKTSMWQYLCNICSGLDAMLGTKKAIQKLHPWRLFGFISDSPQINGMATRLFDPKAQAYYIGITAGAILNPYLTHAKLAAQESYFPEIPPVGPLVRIAVGAEEFVELSTSRLTLSTSIAIVSAYTVFFHELAHILRGHIAQVNELNATEAPHLLESELSDVAPVDLERRSFETDADYYAGVWLAEFFISGRIGLPALGGDITERLPRIMMGVLVAYHQFQKTGNYHGGLSRIYVVFSGILARMTTTTKGTGHFAVAMLDEFIETMRNAGLEVDGFDVEDMGALVETTEPALQKIEADFVGKRPKSWGK